MLTSKSSPHLAPDQLIAYFCAEYGITDILPIYSGGLGILAGDIVQEAARQQLPFVAIGLFYKKGYFHQSTTAEGQKESPQPIDPLKVPLELMRDEKGETLLVEVPIQERTVFAQIWRYMVDKNPLYLLDTDHWKNSEADRAITDQLYSGDQGKRIMQELVLGIGGARALDLLGIKPSLYHMNEGHSAFLSLELVYRELADVVGDLVPADYGVALTKVRRKLVFTNHTLVAAGNDAFSHDLIRYYLGKYAYSTRIGIDNVLNWGNLTQQPGSFSVTMLALRTSNLSNAVSKVHAQKARGEWPEYPLIPITNGVHLPAWIAGELQTVFNKVSPEWSVAPSNPANWRNIRKISNPELWSTHQHLKSAMLDEVYARSGIRLNENVLTVVWARRFATYKRPDLLFADLEKLKALLFNSDQPMQVIVAGKSHPQDGQGKEIIKHIESLANYELKHHAVFVDDYSISLAKFLVSGADVWLNTPIFGLEASGTSGMKAAANGVIQCTVPDGWANEVDWYGVGYSLPADKTETEIYPLFAKKILPTYYRKNAQGVPEAWVAMMKESIATIAPAFSSNRLVNDYVQKLYLPTLG